MKKLRRPMVACAVAATVLLAGCSSREPDREPDNMTVEDVQPSPEPTPEPSAEPSSRLSAPDASIQSNAMDELTEEPTPPDAQMMDDAAASGMTARSSRGDPASRETPGEVVEQK